MLTADLVKPRLSRRNGELKIRWLPADPLWTQTAVDLINLLYGCLNETNGVWQAAVDEYCGVRTDYIVIRGLAKVLSDQAVFKPDETAVLPSDLREQLFRKGPVFRQPVGEQQSRAERFAEVVEALEESMNSGELDGALFADRPINYRLQDVGAVWTADSLIGRYNLELARAALYWSDGMEIELHDHFKDFWKFMKLFKLMFWATPITEEEGSLAYQIALDGPISPFVQRTTRYGRQLAAFLPALFLVDRWQMEASVRPPQFGQTLKYRLDNTVPLTSHFKSSDDFDSKLEADFAAEFEAKFGAERGDWVLTREDEILILGDAVMIPDFAVTHKTDGRRALIEIVGFWHPNYLQKKLWQVRQAQQKNLILLVYEKLNVTPDKLVDVPSEVLYFKSKPVLKELMPVIERAAV